MITNVYKYNNNFFVGTRAVSFLVFKRNGIYLGVITSKILLYYKNRFNVKKKRKVISYTLYYFSYQEFVYFDIKYKGVLCYTSNIFNKLKKYNEIEEGDIKCAVK